MIPYAGDNHYWHTGVDKTNWIQKLARSLPLAYPGANPTGYGYYLIGPDGTVYSRVDDLARRGYPGSTAEDEDRPFDWDKIFVEGMKRFRENPPKPVQITEQELRTPSYIGPDKSVSVVRVYSRLKAERNFKADFGVSHLWIYEDEIRQMLALTPDAQKKVRLPAALIARLVTSHLVDHQAGDSLVWRADEIRKLDFTAYLVKDEGNTRTFGFDGDFWMEATADGNFAIAGQMVGEFTLNKETARVERFRAYFEGQEKGTVLSARGDNADRNYNKRGAAPLYIAMTETKEDDRIARGVAPVLRTSLKDYRAPKMDATFHERYGKYGGANVPRQP